MEGETEEGQAETGQGHVAHHGGELGCGGAGDRVGLADVDLALGEVVVAGG